MSTINDALRRAQQELQEKQNISSQKDQNEASEIIENDIHEENQSIDINSTINQAIQKQKIEAPIVKKSPEKKRKIQSKISKKRKREEKKLKKQSLVQKKKSHLFVWIILILPILFLGSFYCFHYFSWYKKIDLSFTRHFDFFHHKKPAKKIHVKSKKELLAEERASEMNYLNTLHVDGTVVMGNKRAAIINQVTYYPGDNIHGDRIVAITPDKVKIDNHGEIVALRIQE